MTADVLPTRKRNRVIAALLFFSLFALYHANGSVIEEGDVVPTVKLPIAVLERGRLSFDPSDFPEMFKWVTQKPLVETNDLWFHQWSEVMQGRPASAWRESGHIALNGNRYYIVESPRQHVYVNTFGPVPGLLMLPITAVLHALDPGIGHKTNLQLSISKLHGALFASATAVLVLLAGLRYTTLRRALLVAAAYGVGTCAWAVSSQHGWQQTFHAFFLCLGAYWFLGAPERPRRVALAGLAFGAAMATRPTGMLVFLAVLVYLALRHRRSVAPLLLGAVPPLLLIGLHNFHYFGSPFSFGQELVGHTVAQSKTGSPSLWQTPFYEGLAGLLVSPSRGLVIFSPFLLLAAWGVVRIWRSAELAPMRPLTIAVGLMMGLQCVWFDWWGGWAYGYRPWADVIPLLTLFIVPVIGSVLTSWKGTLAFSVALAWSVFVQALGAFSYDRSWNDRTLYMFLLPKEQKPRGLVLEAEARELAAVERGQYLGPTFCDIDRLSCQHRLWSWDDSLIKYHSEHFWFTRNRRLPAGWKDLSF